MKRFYELWDPLRDKRARNPRNAKGEEIRRLVYAIGTNGRPAAIGERLAELERVVARIEVRIAEIDSGLASLIENAVDPDDVVRKLAKFEGVREVMHSIERVATIGALVREVVCDETGGIRLLLATVIRVPE